MFSQWLSVVTTRCRGQSATEHSSIRREQKNASHYLGVFVVVTFSGFATWFYSAHGTWQQWTMLLHTLLGFWLIFISVPFLLHHVHLVQGFRRPGQALMGWLSVLGVMGIAASGAVIGVVGQYEAQRWLYDLHIVAAFAIVLLVLGHLLVSRWVGKYWFADNKRRASPSSLYDQVVNRRLISGLLVGTLLTAVLVLLLTLVYDFRESSYEDVAAVPFTKLYGDGVFSPSLAQTKTGSFLDSRRIGRSEKCAACHQQITDEWRSSMHGRAASDPFFQKNVNSLVDNKGIEATRYCGGCHMPVALLSGELSKGGTVSSGMHVREGVSCMGCHGISDILSLKGVGGYLYEPEQDYLFGDSDGFLQTELHDYLMKINPRQHREDMARDILADPLNCATCHEQYIDKDLNDWGWVQLQRQYSAWVKGPFSRHSDIGYSNKAVMRCQDCHFPLVVADDPSADEQGRVRSHRTPAANTAVPYLLGDQQQLDTVTRFLQDNRVTVSVKQAVANNRRNSYLPGETVRLHVAVSSNRIGHDFPAGTVDINQPWIELLVTDAKGRQVYASGLIGDDNRVDSGAVFYYSSLVNRLGQRVWRHDLFNAVGESYGRLIAPGMAEVEAYAFEVPENIQGPLNVRAKLRYRKFNHDYSSWALNDEQLTLPVVDMAEGRLVIQIQSE